jgi:hypothetical protein
MEYKKFADLFPGSLHDHLTEIVNVTILESVDTQKADVSVEAVLKSVEQLKVALVEQGFGELVRQVGFDFECLDHSLAELKTYFRNPDETHINKKDAFIFAYFVNKSVRKLIDRVKWLDENRRQ